MNKAWNVMKKGFDKKTPNLKEPILNPIRRGKRFTQKTTTLSENDRVETVNLTGKGDDHSKRTQSLTKSPLEVNHQNESQSEVVLKTTSDNVKEGSDEADKLIRSKSKRIRMRKTKRCHLCRKRGHIQKECPFNPVFQN